MNPTRSSATGTQRSRNPNEREDRTEGVVDQAAEAVRNVAEGAGELARDTYEQGSRYMRDAWNSLPDLDRYGRAVSRPIEENPLVAMVLAGAMGYILAYFIHGTGSQWSSPRVPDYARTGDYNRTRAYSRSDKRAKSTELEQMEFLRDHWAS